MEKDVTAGEGSVRNSSGRTVGASVWGGSSTWVAGDVQREKKEEEGKNGGGEYLFKKKTIVFHVSR